MKKLRIFIAGLAVAMFGLVAIAPAAPLYAIDPLAVCSDPVNQNNAVCENKDEDAGSLINLLVNVLLFLVGAIAVIMIIVGGISYTTSAGDASKVTGAKNTIMYAIVGLVVSLIAYAIVNWVLKIF